MRQQSGGTLKEVKAMNKYHILICDDEEGVRESLRAYLEDYYKLSFAKNGGEAIDSVKSNAFDLVIIDIKMPGIDGLEAIRQIKKVKPAQKIIVLTGYESTSIAGEASKLGINSYLTKPIGREKLLNTIKDLLK